jgi:hypothetical protein
MSASTSTDDDPAELALVDLLCRMQLMAMRLGCRIVVVEPSAGLRELIHLAGVDDVLLCPACAGERVSPGLQLPVPLPSPSPRPPAAGSAP